MKDPTFHSLTRNQCISPPPAHPGFHPPPRPARPTLPQVPFHPAIYNHSGYPQFLEAQAVRGEAFGAAGQGLGAAVGRAAVLKGRVRSRTGARVFPGNKFLVIESLRDWDRLKPCPLLNNALLHNR